MASPAGNERAWLISRAGPARAGAIRAGFTPADTAGTTNEKYMWTFVRGCVPTKEPGGADTTWTQVKG